MRAELRGKQRFKFNFLLQSDLQGIGKAVRANPRRERKLRKDHGDFNTWMESLHDYVKTASCGIYSVKKIRTIERSENWLLFKVHLFARIDAARFFRSLTLTHRSTATPITQGVQPAEEQKHSFMRKFSNPKLMDLGLRSRQSLRLDHFEDTDAEASPKSTDRRISKEKKQIMFKKIRSITRVKIHLRSQKTLQNIYEAFIQDVEKVP